MDEKLVLLIATIMTASLAGCAGDPDESANDDMNDTLNDTNETDDLNDTTMDDDMNTTGNTSVNGTTSAG